MRLYLSSYQLGETPDVLADLARGARHAWVIANALEGLDEARRAEDTARQITALAAWGIHAQDFDLRCQDPVSVSKAFGSPDLVWVRGGNVFTLRMAMARSGADELIRRGIERNAFVYGGFSAGACVLAP